MTHLPFTLLAYFFNALSVLANKFLLQKTIADPKVYIFYISLFSLLAILGLPFTKIPTFSVFTLASFSTLLWTLGAYFMFKALKWGQVSRVVPIIGTIIPLILLIAASSLNAISPTQTVAVLILVAGLVFLTATDWQKGFSKKEIIFEVLSAFSFAISYLLLREAYKNLDFFSVLVWSRLILVPFCIFFLLSHFRKNLKPTHFNLLFLGGQVSGVASELLILFSISLANPALVNSLQGTQYVFLFIFALVLSRKYPQFFEEKYNFRAIFLKILGIGTIGLGLYLLSNS